MPVSSAWTMSVRSFSLTPRLNSWLNRFASSGLVTYLPKFLPSLAGYVALYLSFSPIGITTSLMSGFPTRLTCFHFGLPLRRTFIDSRSVVDQTPTRELASFGPLTSLPSRVTSSNGTCSTNACVL